jgi:hypothetical protein
VVTGDCGEKQQQVGRQKRMPSETPRHARRVLGLDFGQFSSGRGRKVQEKNEDDRRRSLGMDGGENRFLGGSDPTLSGMEAAQRLRRRGSLPPKLLSRFPRSVTGRVVSRKPNQFESLTAEEMKTWP